MGFRRRIAAALPAVAKALNQIIAARRRRDVALLRKFAEAAARQAVPRLPNMGFSFSTRASQLWRFSVGSNASVLKKTSKGGTANAKELAAQMDSRAQAALSPDILA